MPIPRAVARFNRYVTNPIARRVAGWIRGFCILTHVGRRTGREYRIPVNVFRSDSGFVFALFYGANADWVQNVMAAGRCSIRYRGEEIELTDLRFLPTGEGMAHMPPHVRVLLRALDVTEFLAGEISPERK